MADDRDNPDESIPLPDLDDAADLVEVYATDNDMAANTVIDELLAPAGIRAFRHDRRSHALFAPASMPGEIGVAVRSSHVARAHEILREARRDGVLTEEGHVPDEGGEDEGETGTA